MADGDSKPGVWTRLTHVASAGTLEKQGGRCFLCTRKLDLDDSKVFRLDPDVKKGYGKAVACKEAAKRLDGEPAMVVTLATMMGCMSAACVGEAVKTPDILVRNFPDVIHRYAAGMSELRDDLEAVKSRVAALESGSGKSG